MKILKKLLIFILAVLAIVLIVAAFAPSEFAVQKEITINKPKSEVFNYVKYLKNQHNYGVWSKRDPEMKRTYKGEDGTVGFVSIWDSEDKDVGKGEQEIKVITEGEKIDWELRFKEPFESTSQCFMTCESLEGNETKVIWGFSGSMPYPMNFMMLFINMEEGAGKDFSDGLSNLKTLLEE